jgi:hypothetical protein
MCFGTWGAEYLATESTKHATDFDGFCAEWLADPDWYQTTVSRKLKLVLQLTGGLDADV